MMQIVICCLLLLCATMNAKDTALPEPYRSIKKLPLDLSWGNGSWFGDPNKMGLLTYIKSNNPKVIIEIGSWLGESAIFMASKLSEDGRVYCIDHWFGGPSQVNHPNIKSQKLFQQFLSNVIYKKMAHKIIPIRMSSREAAQSLHLKADLIYIDGSHDPHDAYLDAIEFYPLLKAGGLMCGDDWHAVKAGIEQAAQELGVTIKVHGNFWKFSVK